MGAVCCHGNAHTWKLFSCVLVTFSRDMSGEKPRWVKRKRQMSRVESMLAAKAQKSRDFQVFLEALL